MYMCTHTHTPQNYYITVPSFIMIILPDSFTSIQDSSVSISSSFKKLASNSVKKKSLVLQGRLWYVGGERAHCYTRALTWVPTS